VREETEALCDAFTDAERACFDDWCRLLDRRPRGHPDEVVASQAALHAAAIRLREWCLADPAAAEAERQELMDRQAAGEAAWRAAARVRQPAADRTRARFAWNGARWAIICQRDALTCGLGWPHRGERVTVTTTRTRDGAKVPYTGAGIYLHSSDVHNVGHAVWMPVLGADHHKAAVSVRWLNPGDDRTRLRGPADPAGGIAMRLPDAPDRPLPVPLDRWPGYSAYDDDRDDDDPPATRPAPAPELFAAAEVPAPQPARQARAARGQRERPAKQAAGSDQAELTLF